MYEDIQRSLNDILIKLQEIEKKLNHDPGFTDNWAKNDHWTNSGSDNNFTRTYLIDKKISWS